MTSSTNESASRPPPAIVAPTHPSGQAQLRAALLVGLGGLAVPVLFGLALVDALADQYWVNVPLHASVESVGAAAALALAWFLVAIRRYETGSDYHTWAATGLAIKGGLELAHASVPPGETFVGLLSSSTFLGGLMFGLLWLPRGTRSSRYMPELSLVLGIVLTLAGFVVSSTWTFLRAEHGFALSARALNVLGGCGFIAAAVWFTLQYRRTGHWVSVVLAIYSAMTGAGGLLFEISALWDAAWWWRHAVILFANGVVLLYIANTYRRTIRNLQRQTERRRDAEATLQEQAALARLGELAAIVAHEVRNPLAGIRGAIQILSSAHQFEAPEREVIQDIMDRIDGLNRIVGDLLAYGRPRPLHIGPVEILPLLNGTAELVESRPGVSTPRITVEGTDVTILADGAQLGQALLNVLANAAEASGDAGSVRVTVRVVDGLCNIDVDDEGPGVDEDDTAKLFEPFYTTKARGTGLGLAVTKRIVLAHGGEVSLERRADSGTRVTVRIPASGLPGSDGAPRPEAGAGSGGEPPKSVSSQMGRTC